MTTAPAELFDYDPFSPAAMAGPDRFYPTLRDRFPAYYIPDYDSWAISRYADVWEGFYDSTHFSEAEGQIFSRDQLRVHNDGTVPQPRVDPMDMFNHLDPPLHTRLRQVMAAPFLKACIAGMEADLTRLVRDRLDLLLIRGGFDLNADFASHVSTGATCLVEGVPLSEVPRLVGLMHIAMARAPNQPGFTKRGMAAFGEMAGMLAEIVAWRRRGAGDGNRLVDALIGAEFLGRRLSDAEIASQLVAILAGGSETVPKVFAGGLLELWKRPDQLAEVSAAPDTATIPAFEEMLRYRAPAQWFGRTVKAGRTLAGAELKLGQRVILLIAAANRDPREFDDPDAFVWNRRARRMLSFGVGPHFCIGIHLARMEGRIMLREFLTSVAEFEIDEAAGDWAASEFQIGWTRLPVRITAQR